MDDSGKLIQKLKANPAVPLGLVGLLGVVIYGAYNFKTKKLKTSLYLIHLRVAAQGTFMTCITLGVVYSLFNKNYNKLFPVKKN